MIIKTGLILLLAGLTALGQGPPPSTLAANPVPSASLDPEASARFVRMAAQTPPTPGPLPPATPIHFDCVSTMPAGIAIKVDWDRNPFEALKLYIDQRIQVTTDKTPPVITSVIYTGGATVLDDRVKIPGSSTSVQFSVAASDDVGLQSFTLKVDGYLVASGNGGAHSLADNGKVFAARWNFNTTEPGWHDFSLTVYDWQSNASQPKSWRMEK